MNQDAVENPSRSGVSPDSQLEIRDKHGMARKVVILSGSDVDSLSLNDAATSAQWRRQVSVNSVDPLPVHPVVTPSHKRLRKYDWLSKINALKNRITTPTLSSLDVFSFSKKEAGDVDLVCSKKKEREKREDGVDPNPSFAENTCTVSEQEGSQVLVQACAQNRDVDGCEDDVPVPTSKRNAGFNFSLGVDSVFYDFEGSHSVDDINRFNVDGSHEADAIGRCQCVDLPFPEQSDCVDPQEEYQSINATEHFQTADRVDTRNFIHEAFSDPTDILSSSIDPGETLRDWEPHEAEAILSDIYQDLGETCICLVEDGCICSLEECQCPDQDAPRITAQGTKPDREPAEDITDKENKPTNQPHHTYSLKRYRMAEMEGTNIDLDFHQSISGEEHTFSVKSKRRKNSKLSERVICKRKLSPRRQETGVDPKEREVNDVAVYGAVFSDDSESVDPSPDKPFSSNTRHKTGCRNDTSNQTNISPDIFYSEDYNTGVKARYTEISIGDAQLLDCIAAADDNLAKHRRAEVDDLKQSQAGADAQMPMISQTEISEDGFSCLTEMKSRSSYGTLTKAGFLAFNTAHIEDENANKHASDNSQTSCNFHVPTNTIMSEMYKLPLQNEPFSHINNMGNEEDKLHASDPTSTRETVAISDYSLRSSSSKHNNMQNGQATTKESSPSADKLPTANASFNVSVGKVRISKIPKRRSTKTQLKGTQEQGEESKVTSSGSHIKSAQRMKNCTTSQSKESQNKFSGKSYSKTRVSNNQCAPSFEAHDSLPAEEEQKLAHTSTGTDNIEPYIPQMITFYTHKDAKMVTTIPPACPKSCKTAKASSSPVRPEWNCSTVTEKPKKAVRPTPLVSKRHNSPAPSTITSARSESSKQSLSSARMQDSVDRMSSSLSVSSSMGRSQSECRTSLAEKMDKHGEPPTKQPFRPAGATSVRQHERKHLIPASNTARSHPDLRVLGGRVEIPVVYPGTIPQRCSSKSEKRAGEKRGHDKSFDEDTKTYIMSDKNVYPSLIPETGLNANSSNSAACEAWTPRFHPWPAGKTPLVTKRVRIDAKQNIDISYNLPKGNDCEQVSTLDHSEQHVRHISKLPVPCWKYNKVRKLGCLRSVKRLKMKPTATSPPEPHLFKFSAVQEPTHKFQPEFVRYTTQVPVIDLAMMTKDIHTCLSSACTQHQQTKLNRNSAANVSQNASPCPKINSVQAPPMAVFFMCDLSDDVKLLNYFQSLKIKKD